METEIKTPEQMTRLAIINKLIVVTAEHELNEVIDNYTQGEVEKVKKKLWWFFGGILVVLVFVVFLPAFLVLQNRYESREKSNKNDIKDSRTLTIADSCVMITQGQEIKKQETEINHYKHLFEGLPKNIKIKECSEGFYFDGSKHDSAVAHRNEEKNFKKVHNLNQ